MLAPLDDAPVYAEGIVQPVEAGGKHLGIAVPLAIILMVGAVPAVDRLLECRLLQARGGNDGWCVAAADHAHTGRAAPLVIGLSDQRHLVEKVIRVTRGRRGREGARRRRFLLRGLLRLRWHVLLPGCCSYGSATRRRMRAPVVGGKAEVKKTRAPAPSDGVIPPCAAPSRFSHSP